MPKQGTIDSAVDRNQVFTAMGLSGTLGPTYGTAEPRPLTVTDDGKLQVNASVSASINPNLPVIAGTPSDPGTYIPVRLTDGTNYYNASGGAGGGTNVNIVTGTVTNVGTTVGLGTLTNLGSFTNGGTIKEITNIAGGTITTTLTLNTGTITTIAAGTQNTLGTVGTIPGVGTITNLGSVTNAGTIKEVTTVPTVTTVSNLTAGSVAVTAGTIGGKAASGAAAVANPVLIAGTDSGGTVYAPLVDATGAVKVTGASAGTNVNIVTGSLVGTVLGGTLQNLVSGTINALAAGTITTGTVSVTTGTIVGKEVSAAAKVGNGLLIAGTDSGGTIYHPLIDATGAVKVAGAAAGTNVNIVTGTQQTLGTVGVLNAGTLNALASGTITGGTLQNLVSGTINALASGTITAGTIVTSGGSVSVMGTYLEATGSATSATTIIASQDVSNYRFVSVQLLNTFVGTAQLQVSNDNSTFVAVGMQNAANTGNAVSLTSMAATGMYNGIINARYAKLVASSYTSGTVQAIMELYTTPSLLQTFGVAAVQSGAWNVTGTITAGTLTNLATGTINALAAGTITGGTLQNLVSGTINAIAAGTITTGTVSVTTGTVGGAAANAAAASGNPLPMGGTDSGGTIRTILVDSTGVQRASGSVVMTVGTVTTGTLQNLVTGTINALAAGTITGGTLQNLNYGTVNIDPTPIPVRTLITSYGTTGTTGAAVFGTLVAAVGASNKAYITGYTITGIAGTTEASIIIGTFTQAAPAGGTNMVTRTLAVPAGGIRSDRSIPYVSGTNGTICYWMAGAGTVYFQVDYWSAT